MIYVFDAWWILILQKNKKINDIFDVINYNNNEIIKVNGYIIMIKKKK